MSSSEVTITVRGEQETRIAPERATVSVSVHREGAEHDKTVAEALYLSAPVRASLEERAEAGTVLSWASGRLAVHSERPWGEHGQRLEPVVHARVDFTATFDDVAELSSWVTGLVGGDGVEIGAVAWQLTSETRARVERETAASAVQVALSRAEAYAEALGRNEVVPVELADLGLLTSGGTAPTMPRARGVMLAAAAESAPAMDYVPEDIVIAAAVEARFLAR